MKATVVLVAALLGFYGSVAWAADAPAPAATAATRTAPDNAKAPANLKSPRAAVRATPASSTTSSTAPAQQRIPRYVDPSLGQGDAVRCACVARRNQA